MLSLTAWRGLKRRCAPSSRIDGNYRWKVAFDLKRFREKVETQAYISTEDAVRVFSAILCEYRMLGPNSQEIVLTHLEPLLDRLGLTDAVNRAAEASGDLVRSGMAER